MKFSVLISLYSKEELEFFDRAMFSIWDDQFLKPAEIVLVIDGPISIEIRNIVDKWKDYLKDTLILIVLEENLGLGKALNEGLKSCTNDWVFRMDTDDICKPDRFEKQVQYIQENPEVVLFSGQILEFKKDPCDAVVFKSVPIQHDEIIKVVQKRCPFNHMTVAYKKSVIQCVGGYQHHPYMEDYNLWLRVIGAGYKVANHPDVLLYARVGNGMHARRKGLQYIKSEKKLLDLKKKLKIQSPIYANLFFLIRASFRLLPSNLLGILYNIFLRKKVQK